MWRFRATRAFPGGGRRRTVERSKPCASRPREPAVLKREIVLPPEHLYPPDEWRIVEVRWSPRFSSRAETVFALANGYVGVRGTLDEGRPALAPGTYVSGFHETWPITYAEEAYGLARVGRRSSGFPMPRSSSCSSTTSPCSCRPPGIAEYRRVLDMRGGTLRRGAGVVDRLGKHVTVRSSRLVSFEHRHVVAMSYEVRSTEPAPVAMVSRVVNRMDGDRTTRTRGPQRYFDPRLGRRFDHRVLEGRVASDDDGRIVLGYETANSHMTPGGGGPARRRDADAVPARHHGRSRPRRGGPHRGGAAGCPDPRGQVRHVPDLPPGAAATSSRRGATGRWTGSWPAASTPSSTPQRRNLDRFWDRADVVASTPPAGALPAGHALEHVPARPGVVADRRGEHPGQGPDERRLRRALLLGHRAVRAAVPRLHPAPHRPEPAALPAQHAHEGAGAGGDARPAGRPVPVAHDQRRGVVRLLPGRDGAVPPQRRHRVRHPPLRRRARRRRLPRGGRRGDPGRDRPHVGGPRLLRRRRRLPHPRRDRARRVHDRRERQRVHEPDGAPQPPIRSRGRPAARRPSDPRPTAPSPSSWTSIPPRSTPGSVRRRRCTSPTTTTAASRRRTPRSSTGRCGTSRARRRTSSRCCCTSTRSSSTGTRC